MFKVNGKEFKTLKAVAAELGKKRVDRKDLEKLGVIEVKVETLAEVNTETAIISPVNTETAIISVTGITFSEFKTKLREYSLASLEKAVKAVNGNIWEKITNEGIKRMRLTMELKAYYYPDKVKKVTARDSAPVSPWKAITTDKLIAAVKFNNLTYKPTDNEGILRMRLIMALKADGVKPENI